MTKENIITRYNQEKASINSQITSLEVNLPIVQSKIDEIKSPIAQLDERIAELTVLVNTKIQEISTVSIAATSCGCGLVTSYIETNPSSPSFGSTVTVSVGSTYFYERTKTLRMNGEDITYEGINPFSPLSGTNGTTEFNSGTGSSTIVVGANSDAILEIVVTNGGSGYASTLSPYYGLSLVGGSGSGAKVDIIVSTAGTVSNVIVANGGSGYKVNDTPTVAEFPGVTLKITDVGSPILGVGTVTYVDANSTIGSAFVATINQSGISSCPTSCSSYYSQVNSLISQLNSLKSQRQLLIDGVNVLKNESKRLFVERYSYIYSRGQLNSRKSEIDGVIEVLVDNDYASYFS